MIAWLVEWVIVVEHTGGAEGDALGVAVGLGVGVGGGVAGGVGLGGGGVGLGGGGVGVGVPVGAVRKAIRTDSAMLSAPSPLP